MSQNYDFLIKDKKNMFARLEYEDFISCKTVDNLESMLKILEKDPSSFLDEKTLSKKTLFSKIKNTRKMFEIIKTLPIIKRHYYPNRDDTDCEAFRPDLSLGHQHGYVSAMRYATLSLQKKTSIQKKNFYTANDTSVSSDPKDWSLDELKEIGVYIKDFKFLLNLLNVDINFKDKLLASSSKFAKEMLSGDLSINIKDPVRDISESQSFAIYIPSHEGYLAVNGDISTLSVARTFESEESALISMKRTYLSNKGVLVKIESKISKLASQPPVDSDITVLSQALALMEKKSIQDALEMASVEQLRAKIEQLENDGILIKPQITSRKKKI